ncbi:cell division cycle 20.3, cofactor of APC complex-like [Salvia miltiorrhiza]|uniref:cell division cycle 20.3, cofactor of APC complex-like n=1 Tax=Salvia miltiorrhiza TaxID=226208 RepID=UPI0025ACAE60|nr:cell division cycle 20.3, cofactor of APC complex-like [Salvia miltiorrhiza]
MEDERDWRLASDWYSPTRLHDSPVKYDFPGDRFIPNRSLMDLDQAHGALTNRVVQRPTHTKSSIEYRKSLSNLTLNADGRPFQMLVFRGSPKSSRKPNPMVDETRRSNSEYPTCIPLRRFPKGESKILDAPGISHDYYLNIVDWGKENILAAALDRRLYLWDANTGKVDLLSEVKEDDYLASVSWSENGRVVAAGNSCSTVHLYDVETLHLVRLLEGHRGRVGSIAWNGHTVACGTSSGDITNHDVRVRNSQVCRVKVHKGEVCGLKWSGTGSMLASGASDRRVYLWDACKMSEKHHVYRFDHHCAAVKALAWCPHDYNVLASGGGLEDGNIKLWNTQKGTCTSSTETKSQICGLQWNKHHKELLSGHGYGYECQNQLCLWRYPSMSRIGESRNAPSRVLHLTQSPNGLTVVSAGEDEALRFWNVFGPEPPGNSRMSYLQSLLSLKTSPIR